MKRQIYIANIHMVQFGNFEQFKSKEEETADNLPQEKNRKKAKLEGLQANLNASVALHIMYLARFMSGIQIKTICTSLVTKMYL